MGKKSSKNILSPKEKPVPREKGPICTDWENAGHPPGAHPRADSLEDAAYTQSLSKVHERGEVSSLKLRNGVGLHGRNEKMVNSPLEVPKQWWFLSHDTMQKSKMAEERDCCHLPRDSPSMAMLPSIAITRISMCVLRFLQPA